MSSLWTVERLRPGRLHGKALRRLYEEVRDREGECCALCGLYVPEGQVPHHEVPKSQGGTDTLDGMLLLCYDCHQSRHFDGNKGQKIRRQCEKYLRNMYGGS